MEKIKSTSAIMKSKGQKKTSLYPNIRYIAEFIIARLNNDEQKSKLFVI